MPLIRINKNPSRRELNWFGAGFLGCCLVMGAVLSWGQGANAAAGAVVGAAALLTAVYYAIPWLRRPLYLGWMYAAMPIGVVMSMLLLVLAYFLVFTPVGLLVRLLSHDPMTRTFDRGSSSYWVRRPATPPASRYFRQF